MRLLACMEFVDWTSNVEFHAQANMQLNAQLLASRSRQHAVHETSTTPIQSNQSAFTEKSTIW